MWDGRGPLEITPQISNQIRVWALPRPLPNHSSFSGFSFVKLDVCFGWLSGWKMKFFLILSFLAEAWRACANIVWYLEPFTPPPPTWTKAPDHNTLPHMLMGDFKCVFANTDLARLCKKRLHTADVSWSRKSCSCFTAVDTYSLHLMMFWLTEHVTELGFTG